MDGVWVEVATSTTTDPMQRFWMPYGPYAERYVPVKPKRKPMRVFEMKRLVKTIMGKCVGFMVNTNPSKGHYMVALYFDNETDARRLYAEIAKLDPMRDSSPSPHSQA